MGLYSRKHFYYSFFFVFFLSFSFFLSDDGNISVEGKLDNAERKGVILWPGL